jgi:hypothetical protein
MDVNVITDLERRINEVQLKYPDGYFWNRYTPDSRYPNVTTTPCDHPNGIRNCIGQCAGFAHLMSNEVFGSGAGKYNVTNVNNVRQGDYIRYSRRAGHNHSIFIVRVQREGEIIGYDRWNRRHIRASSTQWLVTDCNWTMDCQIDWNRWFDPERFVTTFNARESYSRRP